MLQVAVQLLCVVQVCVSRPASDPACWVPTVIVATQTQRYQSALAATGNLRPIMQRRTPQAPLAVGMISADCKVVQLHEKPVVSMFKSTSCLPKASLLYTQKHVPRTRASTESINRNKKRLPSPSKPPPHDAAGGRTLQNVHMPPVRKSNPGNSIDASDRIVRATDLPGTKPMHSLESNVKKTTKVFLSDKQSRSIRECGVLVPCAPPATPTPEYRQKFDIIPSMADVRAQRHMRQRLEGICKSDQTLKKQEKKREEQLRQEKMSIREKVLEMKKRQRQEIYALNRIMTDLEYSHFEAFVKERGFNE